MAHEEHASLAEVLSWIRDSPVDCGFTPNVKILSSKTIVRILKSQETIFKYGTFIPRNDREA
jgi:hypothetical protein